MIKKLLKKKPAKKRPEKTTQKMIPAKMYNELIDYYTKELEALRQEIARVNEQNTLIMKTAMKQGDKVRELEERNKKLAAENIKLQE